MCETGSVPRTSEVGGKPSTGTSCFEIFAMLIDNLSDRAAMSSITSEVQPNNGNNGLEMLACCFLICAVNWTPFEKRPVYS